MSDYLRIFKGLLIDDGEILRASRFGCFGEMDDGTKCFHEVDENGEKVSDAWYSFGKYRDKESGKVYNLFYLEGIN